MSGQLPPDDQDDRLRHILSFTDAALSRLGAADLLEELLDRVREALGADTAVVLLLDEANRELVATFSRGLEEEVRQGARIPMGRGFAGRVAAERRPVILSRVDSSTVVNPILLDHGVQSLLGVPLLAAGSLVGVMHVGSVSTRMFGTEDAELLQVAAERAALAVREMQAKDDRSAIRALQRSLGPGPPPVVAGMRMAARYVTGDGVVGGDWYDVFPLPSGELGVVIGDVAGSGLNAAVVMGRMRSTLRAYTLETSSPADALGRLDRKMQYFESDAMATVLYAILDSRTGAAVISSAGHLPPVLAFPGCPGELAPVEADPPIGVTDAPDRHDTTLTVPPGGLVAFYTDGLVERRGQSLSEGLKRLCVALETASPDGIPSPEQGCIAVMRALIGTTETTDDVALLIVERSLSLRPRQAAAADSYAATVSRAMRSQE
jgi:sigma-B regulation protein RsbU (phosphoserine phosphatase)